MNRIERANRNRVSVHGILFRTVGILLVLTMLSLCILSGLLAKYLVSGQAEDSARVAGSGFEKLDIWEHEAEDEGKTGIYTLLDGEDDDLVRANTYDKVIPGVDIPKDPFVHVELVNPEVTYELYIEVVESDNFPKDTVTYTIRTLGETTGENPEAPSEDPENPGEEANGVADGDPNEDPNEEPGDTTEDGLWIGVPDQPNVYKYKETLVQSAEGYDLKIPILVDDKLYVSERYVGKTGETFTLTFRAWLQQVD